MAENGSRRWFQYLSDNNLSYAVELDESTYEVAELGMTRVTPGAAGPVANGRILQVSAGRPLSMRYANLARTDGDGRRVTKRVFIGLLTTQLWQRALSQVTINGEVWTVTSTVGERAAFVPATDTGIIDGDQDQNFLPES